MNDMVERVTDALIGRMYSTPNGMTEEGRDLIRAYARAAIVAMREQPLSADVMERLIVQWPVLEGGGALMKELWQAMIDEALK